MNLKLTARAEAVKKTAAEFGFMDCRIARASRLDHEAMHFEQWLERQHHGTMSYMENHFEKRIDPRKLVDGAKSVIVVSKNYFPDRTQHPGAPKLSKYAYGRDYHKVIRKQLKHFLSALDAQFGGVNGRGFVDSAPVLEKAWAQRSGLGWMGKHTNILTKKRGSFFFLAVLIVDVELAADDPVTDHCGSCTACIDACPTEAIVAPYLLDASKCISYYTIELKANELPADQKGNFEQWMFGCDICQDVCPWNRFSRPHSEPDFEPREGLLEMSASDWRQLKREKFEELFSGSAVKRTGYEGLMRNIRFVTTSTAGSE